MKKILRDNNGSISALVVISVLLYSIVLTTAFMQASSKRKMQMESQILAKEAYEKQLDNLDEIRDEVIGLPRTNETQPYYPSREFKQVKETNLDNGLVIEDGNGNQYVWVEVPKNTTVYPTAGLNITNFTDDEYTKIENDLHTYTSVYRNGTGRKDTWVADNNNTGWFTESEYYAQKKTMLKSVYQNGGFYVGRYEAGIGTNRMSIESQVDGKYPVPTTAPVTKADAYPYTYVTRTQAQNLASNVNSGTKTSSLMFGVQWDLVLAFMRKDTAKITSTSVLTENSTTIGNYCDNLWTIKNANAQYSEDGGDTFKACPNPFKKESYSSILLTTGADSSFSVQNIYDIAGNVFEWTLEKTSNDSLGPCAIRGGYSGDDGSAFPADDRSFYNTTAANDYFIGFRVTLW